MAMRRLCRGKAGVRSIEHGTSLGLDLRLMKEKGTYLVPTFSTLYDLLEPGGDRRPGDPGRAMHMIPRARRRCSEPTPSVCGWSPAPMSAYGLAASPASPTRCG
jgi:hypothetical protein